MRAVSFEGMSVAAFIIDLFDDETLPHAVWGSRAFHVVSSRLAPLWSVEGWEGGWWVGEGCGGVHAGRVKIQNRIAV